MITKKPLKLAFVNVWEPASHQGRSRYCVTVLIPKSDVDTLEQFMEAERKVADGRPYVSSIRDGDIIRPDDEHFYGCYCVRIASLRKPRMIYIDGTPITEHSQMYSGVICQVQTHAYWYDHGEGSRGVAFGLDGLKKISDGESTASYRKEW